MSNPSAYMIVLTIIFKFITLVVNTQPYFILKVLEGSGLVSFVLR